VTSGDEFPDTTRWFPMRPLPARGQMRSISIVVTTFPGSLQPAVHMPEQPGWSRTENCRAELVGRQSTTRPAVPIHQQFLACCKCATKCLECRDSQLGCARSPILALCRRRLNRGNIFAPTSSPSSCGEQALDKPL